MYKIPFETPIGCLAELQSNNPNFDLDKLKLIVPLLVNFPSIDEGYNSEFGHVSIFPFNQKFDRKEDYIKYAENQYLEIQVQNKRLLNLNVPIEFDTLKKTHLNNRGVRMKFTTVLLDWVKYGDDKLLGQKLLILNNDPQISSLLNSILLEKTWEDKFLKLSVRMGNFFNTLNIDLFISSQSVQNELFKQNKIAILDEPNCYD